MKEDLRHRLSDSHPALQGWKKLSDDDLLQDGDETSTVSTLLSLRGDRWYPVLPEWADCIGKTVRHACEETADADGHERVFRRQEKPCT